MATRGGGPSRRSHTKSRKGCKTCKRRHIRCDEAFPQCSNCTKHHVKCDYADTTTLDGETMSNTSSEQTSPSIRPILDESHARSNSAVSEVELNAEADDASAAYGHDAHLIQNLSTIMDDLEAKGVGQFTTWTKWIRRHISICTQYPYYIDALKAFSASQIAWISQSTAIHDKAAQYSLSSVSGLHRAIGQFDKTNADSVLGTAMVLTCQGKDWLAWSSLVGGMSTVSGAIGAWQEESAFSDLIPRINAYSYHQKNALPRVEASCVEKAQLLGNLQASLQLLRAHVASRPVELQWTNQLIHYVTRLQIAERARTLEEQFNHLYILRKWSFWLPSHLLQEGPADIPRIAFIAHLYATCLALEPIFPAIAADFVGNVVSTPLSQVLDRMEEMIAASPADFALASLIEFPRSTYGVYSAQNLWPLPRLNINTQLPDISMWIPEELAMSAPGNLSPAFHPTEFMPAHSRNSSSNSNIYLEVPHYVNPQAGGFTKNIAQWDAMPSPIFSATDLSTGGDFLFDDDDVSRISFGEFENLAQNHDSWS